MHVFPSPNPKICGARGGTLRLELHTLQFGTFALFERATPLVIGSDVSAGGYESLIFGYWPSHHIHARIPWW
ncbi:MAG TPA: hypothetical protein VIC29_06765 [Steroidobacteraceae bacterium]|jgi:hypothetical protein